MRRPSFLRDQRGSATVELTLLAPLLILLLLFVVFCGRLADTRLRINDAAHQAVRAATLARSSTQTQADAQSTTDSALASAGVACQNLAVDAHTGAMQPGSTVTVTVTCHIALSDLTGLGIPGAVATHATASSIVDIYRSTGGRGST